MTCIFIIFIIACGQLPFANEKNLREKECCDFSKPLQSTAICAAFCQLPQSRMGPRQALEGSWRPADASTFSSLQRFHEERQQKRSVVLWQLFLQPPHDTSRCCFYCSAHYVHSWFLLLSPSCLLGGPPSSGVSSQQAALQSWCLYCHGILLKHLSSCYICTFICLVSVHPLFSSQIWYLAQGSIARSHFAHSIGF